MAQQTDIAQVMVQAANFRMAIETCNKSSLPITFSNFPKGSCGDAALLLAKYLEQGGRGEFDYILGQRDGHSHAWIQRKSDGLIVDITADQFPDINDSIFVGLSSPWHEQFCGESQHAADFELYDEYTRCNLRSAYAEILNHLPTDIG